MHDHSFKPKPEASSPEDNAWRFLLQGGPDPYDVHRSLGQDVMQQVFKENRASQHITPVLLDQAICLLRASPF